MMIGSEELLTNLEILPPQMPSSSVPKVEHILPEIGTTRQNDGRYPALLNSTLVIAPAQTQINFVFIFPTIT